MIECAELSRLILLFRRASNLPVLPQTALSLVRAIDEGEASAVDLERIISSDPNLATSFLRIAATQSAPNSSQASTLRGVILKLGQRAVRSLATSLVIRDFLAQDDFSKQFEPTRFSHHSHAVAIVARYLFARQQKLGAIRSEWSADELYAVGLLHDLGLALLARVAPDQFSRIHYFALRKGCSLNESFNAIFGADVNELSAAAAEAWFLPDLFQVALKYFTKPWEHSAEYSSLCCLNLANHLVESWGVTTCSWTLSSRLAPEVELELNVPDEEQELIRTHLERVLPDCFGSLAGSAA